MSTIGWNVARDAVALRDARAVVLDTFGSINARSGFLDHVITLLFAVADSGKRTYIAAATDVIEHLLRDRRLI
jgi:hypothetical protein